MFRLLACLVPLVVVAAVLPLASSATPPLRRPVANVHACVPYHDHDAVVSEDGLKIAQNFSNLVADHLRDGNPRALSLMVFRRLPGQANTNRITYVQDPTSSDRELIEKIFGSEIARIATGGGDLSYYESSTPPECGVEARAVLDIGFSHALCASQYENCRVECTASECKRVG
jgi:hypothetical protein